MEGLVSPLVEGGSGRTKLVPNQENDAEGPHGSRSRFGFGMQVIIIIIIVEDQGAFANVDGPWNAGVRSLPVMRSVLHSLQIYSPHRRKYLFVKRVRSIFRVTTTVRPRIYRIGSMVLAKLGDTQG
jgi:hypothetical protein